MCGIPGLPRARYLYVVHNNICRPHERKVSKNIYFRSFKNGNESWANKTIVCDRQQRTSVTVRQNWTNFARALCKWYLSISYSCDVYAAINQTHSLSLARNPFLINIYIAAPKIGTSFIVKCDVESYFYCTWTFSFHFSFVSLV